MSFVDQEKPGEYIQSLERGLAVLRCFSAETPQLTVSEVAAATGLSRATARRFLLTLESLGYVACSRRKFFSLQPRVLSLGYAYLSSFSVVDVAQKHLEELTADLHESSSASVYDDGDIVYIARAPAARILTINLSVGSRLPAYATAMGHVLLASLPEDQLRDYLDRTDFTPFTSMTARNASALEAELAKVRTQGWAMVNQEYEDQLISIAAPIHEDGQVTAAINTSAHLSRVSPERMIDEVLPKLLDRARQIDAELRMRR